MNPTVKFPAKIFSNIYENLRNKKLKKALWSMIAVLSMTVKATLLVLLGFKKFGNISRGGS